MIQLTYLMLLIIWILHNFYKLVCCRIASEMIDRPFEEVRELFGITCDMTKKKMDKCH